MLNLFSALLSGQCVISSGGESVALQNPLGAITGIADAGNRFNVENNTLE